MSIREVVKNHCSYWDPFLAVSGEKARMGG